MHDLMMKNNLLKEKISALFKGVGVFETGIKGFSVSVRQAPSMSQHCFYKPMAIVILDGEKQTQLGTDELTYHENQVLVNSIDLPAVSRITKASPKAPFMALILELDSYLIARLLGECGEMPPLRVQRGMGIENADVALLDAFDRLLSLTAEPTRQKVMVPLLMKEIHYLLLTSSLGDILRAVNTQGSQNHQIFRAVSWLKENYRQPLKMDELAKRVHMAESSFYRHFSRVTSLSPLQYQKQLRLYEAQRLMMSVHLGAAEAAYAVGYESASQFSREYKRLFGISPKLDTKQA